MWDLMDHTFHKKGSLIFLGHGHDLSPPKSILDFSPWNLESIALFLIHKYPNISKCSSQHTRTPLAPESGFRIYSCRSGVAIVASKAWRHWNITRVISFVPNIMPSVELVRLPKFRWSSCKKLIGKYAAIHGYYGFLRFDSNQKPVGQRYVFFFHLWRYRFHAHHSWSKHKNGRIRKSPKCMSDFEWAVDSLFRTGSMCYLWRITLYIFRYRCRYILYII